MKIEVPMLFGENTGLAGGVSNLSSRLVGFSALIL